MLRQAAPETQQRIGSGRQTSVPAQSELGGIDEWAADEEADPKTQATTHADTAAAVQAIHAARLTVPKIPNSFFIEASPLSRVILPPRTAIFPCLSDNTLHDGQNQTKSCEYDEIALIVVFLSHRFMTNSGAMTLQ
jgi:hypothetical protein